MYQTSDTPNPLLSNEIIEPNFIPWIEVMELDKFVQSEHPKDRLCSELQRLQQLESMHGTEIWMENQKRKEYNEKDEQHQNKLKYAPKRSELNRHKIDTKKLHVEKTYIELSLMELCMLNAEREKEIRDQCQKLRHQELEWLEEMHLDRLKRLEVEHQ